MTTRETVLAHIAAQPNGLTFSEIQRFVVESNGLDYDEKMVTNAWQVEQLGEKPKYARKYRGYWCTNLIAAAGPYSGRIGFLHTHCARIGNRYYVLKKIK